MVPKSPCSLSAKNAILQDLHNDGSNEHSILLAGNPFSALSRMIVLHVIRKAALTQSSLLPIESKQQLSVPTGDERQTASLFCRKPCDIIYKGGDALSSNLSPAGILKSSSVCSSGVLIFYRKISPLKQSTFQHLHALNQMASSYVYGYNVKSACVTGKRPKT